MPGVSLSWRCASRTASRGAANDCVTARAALTGRGRPVIARTAEMRSFAMVILDAPISGQGSRPLLDGRTAMSALVRVRVARLVRGAHGQGRHRTGGAGLPRRGLGARARARRDRSVGGEA